MYLIGASWLAQRVLRSESDAARQAVQLLLRHIVQPTIHIPLQLLGLPNLAGEVVESFLAESVEARKSKETASMHTLPLVIAAFNLHCRLRQILDEGHAYSQRKSAGAAVDDPKRQTSHSKAKHELLFLFGEYLAWQEELRRFVHRTTDSRYMQEVRVVSDALSEPLVRDSDRVLRDKEIRAVGGEADLSSTVDSASSQQDSSRSDSSVGRDKRFFQAIRQFFRRTVGGSNVADRERETAGGLRNSSTDSVGGGDEWVEFWLAGVDPCLGPLPVVYRSRAEAVNRQHDTDAGAGPMKQLERNDVVHIWRGLLADGKVMKFVRDTDRLKREKDGTLVCDGGCPIEEDPISGAHQSAPVFWLAAGVSTNSAHHTNVCKSSSPRPGAKAAGTIAAAVVTDDGLTEQTNSNCSDSSDEQCSTARTLPSTSAIERRPAPSASLSSMATVLRDETPSGFASVISDAEEAEEVEQRRRMTERRHQLATLGEHRGGSVRALAPIEPSVEDENDVTQTNVADCATYKDEKTEVVCGEDYRLSSLELRMCHPCTPCVLN
eukprot:COSAG02_NODE_205_length_29157_cov_13.424771_3_plen_549_part_00